MAQVIVAALAASIHPIRKYLARAKFVSFLVQVTTKHATRCRAIGERASKMQRSARGDQSIQTPHSKNDGQQKTRSMAGFQGCYEP
ncbi:hypothetical protein [Rhodanobacter sp. BL-MT-08]